MDKKLRVAAYCRVSTDDQDNSLPNQEKYFKEYISSKENWELVKVYSDEALSGTNVTKRNHFNEMIQNALDGNIDLIITKTVSRFARNTLDSLYYTRMLKDYNVHVLFTLDSIDTRDKDSEFKLTIFASIAQEESRKTSESVKWGHKRRMVDGVVFGRNLLGYRVVDGRLEKVEKEADIVRLIFGKYLEGKGTHIIARELREAGIKPLNPDGRAKYKNHWNNIVILRVLRNEKYVGDLVQKKTYTPNFLDHKKKYNRGEEESIKLDNHHEPIIDRDTWNAVQAELIRRSPSAEQKTKHSNRYWCSGKVECGVCNAKYVSRTKKLGSGDVYKAWRCFRTATHGTSKILNGEQVGCNSESVNEKVLLSCIQYILGFIVINKDALKKELLDEIKALRVIKDTSKDRQKIENKITVINNKIAKLVDLRLSGEITADELKFSKEKYSDEMHGLEVQLNTLVNAEKIQQKQIKEITKYIDEIDRILDFNKSESKEMVYKEVLKKIVVFNNHILHIHLCCMPNPIKVHYETKGKADKYEVIFDDLEIIEG